MEADGEEDGVVDMVFLFSMMNLIITSLQGNIFPFTIPIL